MIRRSVLSDVGLLDEDYFMYFEDADISRRLLKFSHSAENRRGLSNKRIK